MKLIFAGTPEFAREALAALHAAGHEIALVMTQPDRPAGRGMKLQASPVKQFAQEHGMPVAPATPATTDTAAAAPTPTRLIAPTGELPPWSPEAERELGKIPFFVRGKARRNTERFAGERGVATITVETLYDAKAHFSR